MTDFATAGRERQSGVPAIIWVLIVIFAIRAVITALGAFVFSFPMGGVLGISIGIALLILAAAYAVIAWRMRHGERIVWIAAIVSQLVNQGLLTVADLSLYGAIPPEDYAFIVVTVAVLVVLFLPPVRRFFSR